MKKNQSLKHILIGIALLLSHAMCAHVAFAYCDMLWGIKYAGYSAPASVAFTLAIPYLIGILLVSVIVLFWSKGEK